MWQGVSLICSLERIVYVSLILFLCVVAVFQALRYAPMTWLRWPTPSQGVSKSRNPQTPPGRLFLKTRFPSQGTTEVNYPQHTLSHTHSTHIIEHSCTHTVCSVSLFLSSHSWLSHTCAQTHAATYTHIHTYMATLSMH